MKNFTKNKKISFEIKDSENINCQIEIVKNDNIIKIRILCPSFISIKKFSLELRLEDFIELSELFKIYNSIEDIFQYLNELELNKNSNIKIEDKFAIFSFKVKSNLKDLSDEKLSLSIPEQEIKEN